MSWKYFGVSWDGIRRELTFREWWAYAVGFFALIGAAFYLSSWF